MPANNPQVGEIYNTLSSGADQWLYVYEVKGPYVYVSGIHNTQSHTKMRREVARGIFNHCNYGSNGIRMMSGDILGLCNGSAERAEGVLFLEGEDTAVMEYEDCGWLLTEDGKVILE